VHQVAFAAQENTSRPILSGVYLATKKTELRIAATDSYRLSEKVVTLGSEAEEVTCTIPVRAIFEADRLVGNAESIQIMISENQVMFSIGGTELVSRLIEGAFPDYTQIIPQSYKTTADIDRAALERFIGWLHYFGQCEGFGPTRERGCYCL